MKAEQVVPSGLDRQWPQAGATRVPYWAYSDQQVYQREMDVIFCGESWAYVGLGVEIPNPGDFKQVSIGDRPLVMCRDEDGAVHVFENRCAHRGVKFCREPWGMPSSLRVPTTCGATISGATCEACRS